MTPEHFRAAFGEYEFPIGRNRTVIDLSKRYTVNGNPDVEVFSIHGGYAYGRVGEQAWRWHANSGRNVTSDQMFDLVEAPKWVKTRRSVSIREKTLGGDMLYTSDILSDYNSIGLIDIIHDGNRLISVEIVNTHGKEI